MSDIKETVGQDITSLELKAAGKSGRRITREAITSLVERVVFKPESVGTSTFVHAFLDGKFYLGTGHSACVDPSNYILETGLRIAKDDAIAIIKKKLWELEGYVLYKEMNNV